MKFFIMQMMQQYHRDQEVKKKNNFDTEMLTKKADLQVFSEVQIIYNSQYCMITIHLK